MGNQKTLLLQKENAEPLKSGNKTADSKKPGKRASEKPMNMPGKGFGSLSDIPLTPENILFLQRTIGNRATTKLVQAKLKIGQPGDEYEREADQVAEQVTRTPETSPAHETAVSNQANVGQIQRFNPKHEEELQRQPMEEEEKRKRQEEEGALQMKPVSSLGMVQRQSMAEEEKRKRMEEEGAVSAKENPGQTPAISPKVESQIEAMRGSGEQLPESVRAHFEPRFDQDFSEVRVHKDAQAAESAQAINARAYTTGRDIVFGSGEYAPETGEGKRLLAHELTHVVQQKEIGRKIQLARLSDFSDASNPAFDPSSLSDAQIEATNEFKAYMAPTLVWQWHDHVTREEALLACRLILRAIREGRSVDWDSGARVFLNRARRQFGTVEAIEPYVGTVPWSQQSPDLLGTDFGRWLLAGGNPPNVSSFTMNCWEIILFGASEKGYVSQSWLQNFYQQFVANLAATSAAGGNLLDDQTIENALRASDEYTFDPANPDSPSPLAGDFVIFRTAVRHTAISLGTTTGGKHNVISLWNRPGNSLFLQQTTIEDLLASGANTPVKFWSAGW